MKMCDQIITYWLCPAEPARSELSAIIHDFAVRFDAPRFEPHVTIFVTRAERENPVAVLDKVVNPRAPYRLAVRALDYSDKFTKTLFVQFSPDPEVSRLSEDLQHASTSPSDYELKPHLSLIYKEMDEETKRQLAASIALPFTDVIFDSVKAVISPATITSREDVEAWHVVAEQKFTG